MDLTCTPSASQVGYAERLQHLPRGDGIGGVIYTAWRVWKVPGNKVAHIMYRWSSMYLAFLFLALMLDAVL